MFDFTNLIFLLLKFSYFKVGLLYLKLIILLCIFLF